MYPTCDGQAIVKKAEEFILTNDRAMFKPYYEAIEKFVDEQDGIAIGGPYALAMIKKSYNIEISVIDLYSDSPWKTAKQLTMILYGIHNMHIEAKTICLKTVILDKEFAIFVDTRVIAKFYSMDRYRSVVLIDLMRNVKEQGFFVNKPLRVLPEEIMIIDIYRGLYSPSKIGQWEDLYKLETVLFDRLRAKDINDIEGETSRTGGAKIDMNRVKGIIKDMTWIIKPDDIIIGEYALKAKGIVDRVTNKLQFISSISTSILIREITNLLNRKLGLAEDDKTLKLGYQKYDLAIPGDFMLKKVTIYIDIDGKDQNLCDVYNSTSYEIIPYDVLADKGISNTSNKKYGSYWVLLRFLFIEIWALQMIKGVNEKAGKDTSFFNNKINIILGWIAGLRESTKDNVKFPMTYQGVFIKENVSKKSLQVMRQPYYPALEEKRDKERG